MSKITSIQSNYQPTLKKGQTKFAQNPSFGCAGNELGDIEKAAIKEVLITDQLGWLGTFFNKLSKTTGELQNLLIQNLGTFFVAPIFISNNPLSHENQKTKNYSAWRQPLSAMIAVPISMGTNYYVNRWFDDAAAKGKLAKFDMNAEPSNEYLKRTYKSIKNALKGSDMTGIDVSKLKLDDKRKEILKEITMKKFNEIEGKPDPLQAFLDEAKIAAKKISARKFLNSPNGLKQMTLKDFLIKNLEFSQSAKYSDRLNIDQVKKTLKTMTAMTFLRECGMSDVEENTLRGFINMNIYRNECEEAAKGDKALMERMFKALEEIAQKTDVKLEHKAEIEEMFLSKISSKGLDDSARKTVSKICESFISQENLDVEKIPLETLFKVLNMDKDFQKSPMLNVKMDKFLMFLDSRIQPGALKKKNPMRLSNWVDNVKEIEKLTVDEAKLSEHAENIVVIGAKKAGSALKNYGKLQGILVSMAVIPLQCTLLNWLHPIFIEKFRPHLLADSTENGGK